MRSAISSAATAFPLSFTQRIPKRGERLSTSSALMSATYRLPCGTTVRSCTIRAIQSLPFLMGFRSRLRALAMTLWLWVPDRRALAGVFYGAATVEAPAMAGEDVYVVGGANSAGQAALHLAKFAAHAVLLVRGSSLRASMSEYLITQLEATPNIELRLQTRVV